MNLPQGHIPLLRVHKCDNFNRMQEIDGHQNCEFYSFNYFKGAVILSVLNESSRLRKIIVVKIIHQCIIFARNAIHILINIQQVQVLTWVGATLFGRI